MLTLRDIEYSVAGRTLLHNLQWSIPAGRRLALVGPNGAGKTTLLRIMAGELEPEKGEVTAARHFRVGHLPQETVTRGTGGLMEFVLAGRPDVLALEAQLEALQADPPAPGTELHAWMQRVEELEHRFASQKGYDLEIRARRILSGLGFSRKQESSALATFSGGWRMRALLARLLLGEPDLLLLDEPTNHLDLPSLEWLERFLMGFRGSMILVSHDRFFIDRLAQEIVELENGRLHAYPGRFQQYLEMRAQRRERAESERRKREVERRRQERFIERFRYKASKASQVQSRIKMLEKDAPLPPAVEEVPELNFTLPVTQTSYRDVLALHGVGFAYSPGQWVFRGLNLKLSRGDRVCLVGRNGAGKTTLTRLFCGDLSPREGEVVPGRRVRIGYYAQHQVDALNLERSVIDEVGAALSLDRFPAVRSILGLFGFSGDNVFKPVGVLSGGEKARVSLARILLSGANFLVMDEPTNHLDAHARDALEKALRSYEGTVVLVSHDRWFLDRIVNRVVELGEGTLTEYTGNYSEYLDQRDSREREEASPAREASGDRREQRRRDARARQAVSARRRRLNSEIEELENRIDRLEVRRRELESRLARPDTYERGGDVAELQKEYARVRAELEEDLARWEERHGELDTLLARLDEDAASRGGE